MLEVAREEPGEAGLRQEHLLEQQRLAIGHAETLEVDHGGADRDPQGLRDGTAPPARVRAVDDPGGRVVARCWSSSVNESVPSRSSVDRRARDERSASPRPLQPTLAGEIAQRAADGDEAAPVAGGELALRRQPVPGPPLAGVERRTQVEVDLVVERDRARQEPEACHAVADALLRRRDLLLRL